LANIPCRAVIRAKERTVVVRHDRRPSPEVVISRFPPHPTPYKAQ